MPERIQVTVVDTAPVIISIQTTTADRAELDATVDELGDDEVRVLARIAERLRRGQQMYGEVDAATDLRDFKVEAREELEDFLVYDALRWLKDAARGSVH